MKYFWASIFIMFLIAFYVPCAIHFFAQENNIVQELVELEIIVAEQSNIIQLQALRIKDLEKVQETAIMIAGENYVLKTVIQEMQKSLQSMFEYIQELEARNLDRGT